MIRESIFRIEVIAFTTVQIKNCRVLIFQNKSVYNIPLYDTRQSNMTTMTKTGVWVKGGFLPHHFDRLSAAPDSDGFSSGRFPLLP
jgi:hypothetical protein